MKLDHVVLLASDLEASVHFYATLLPAIGFQRSRETVFSNSDGVAIDLRVAGDAEHGYRRHAPGLNHMGFTAPSRDEIEAVAGVMAAAGFEVPAIQEFDDGSAIFLADPDGLRIEISSYGS
jgi:catechol 2,3-dioxygenase-like lactoylglutathione lyase family enzyme